MNEQQRQTALDYLDENYPTPEKDGFGERCTDDQLIDMVERLAPQETTTETVYLQENKRPFFRKVTRNVVGLDFIDAMIEERHEVDNYHV